MNFPKITRVNQKYWELRPAENYVLNYSIGGILWFKNNQYELTEANVQSEIILWLRV